MSAGVWGVRLVYSPFHGPPSWLVCGLGSEGPLDVPLFTEIPLTVSKVSGLVARVVILRQEL